MLDDVCVPSYYILNRSIPTEQVVYILAALRITPLFCAVISDVLDAALAFEVASDVIRVDSDEAAHVMARKIWADTSRPSLVVGIADVLDAVYEDGKREGVATSC